MDLNIEKKRNSNYKNNLKKDESKTKEVTSFKIYKIKIKWNRKKEEKLYKEYKKRSKRLKWESKNQFENKKKKSLKHIIFGHCSNKIKIWR